MTDEWYMKLFNFIFLLFPFPSLLGLSIFSLVSHSVYDTIIKTEFFFSADFFYFLNNNPIVLQKKFQYIFIYHI